MNQFTTRASKVLLAQFRFSLIGCAVLALRLSAGVAAAQPDPPMANPFGTCTGNNLPCDVGLNNCAAGTCDPCGLVRYISFEVPASSAGSNTAIRVKLSSLHHPSPAPPGSPPSFAFYEGQYRYLNTLPGTLSRCCAPGSSPATCNTSVTCSSDADCVGLGANAKCERNLCPDSTIFETFFRCARIGCAPEYRDWGSDFSGHITYANGDIIVPSSLYDVAHLPASCAGDEEACAEASAEIQIKTEQWGNVDCSTHQVPTALDLGAVIVRAKGALASVIKPRAQFRNANPSSAGFVTDPFGLITATDIGWSVNSVKGIHYTFNFYCSTTIPCESGCFDEPCTLSDFCSDHTDACGYCQPQD